MSITEASPRYLTTPARPRAQVVMRVALWSAVFLGAAGGIAGFVRTPAARPATVPAEETGPAPESVPAPVSSVAERAVATWLAATEGSADRLAELFLAPPTVEGAGHEGFAVLGVTTIAGEAVKDGLWTLTLAVDVEETDTEGTESTDEEQPADVRRSTWYVEVSVVGEADGRLLAVATPTVVPGPPAMAEGWEPAGPQTGGPVDDAIATTVEQFLGALLAGDGDPSRYVAPGTTMSAADPPPFVQLDLQSIGAEQLDDGRLWLRADVSGRTRSGRDLVVAYDLLMAARDGRWEITDISSVLAS